MHCGKPGCPTSTQVPSDARLIKLAKRVHFQESWSVLGWQQTLNWKRTWAAIDDVSQERENKRRTEKYKPQNCTVKTDVTESKLPTCKPGKQSENRQAHLGLDQVNSSGSHPSHLQPVSPGGALPTAAHPAEPHLLTAST